MEIIGYLFCVASMVFISGFTLIVGLLAGFEIGPPPFREYWWYAPLVLVNILLWVTLIKLSPFTIILN